MEKIDKEEKGPGAAFEPFVINENIVERLKLLNYEEDFVGKSDSYKAIPR